MPRLPRQSREQNERILATHQTATDAHPLTEDEVQLWMQSLSALDAVDGIEERLRVCRELLRYAPADHMLDSDHRIVKRAIEQLEEELEREPKTTRARSGMRTPVDVCIDDDDSADDTESAEDPFLGFD